MAQSCRRSLTVIGVVLLLAGCATPLSRLEDAQACLESHQVKWKQTCCVEVGSTGCTAWRENGYCSGYRTAINNLSHAIDVAAPTLNGGHVPDSTLKALKRAEKAAETASTP